MGFKEKKIPVLSFFTGAGFLDIGFINTGFDVVWCNELNPAFARGFYYGMTKLYRHPSIEPKIASIEELNPYDIIRNAFGLKYPPNLFGVIGGPPCPDFSVGGHNLGFRGENGRLTQIYVDKVLELRPTFFLFENVLGLWKTEKHRKYFRELRQRLHRSYATDVRVLNSLDYGVPQDRQRLFLVGICRSWLRRNWGNEGDLNEDGWYPFPIPDPKYVNAKKRYNWPYTSPFRQNPDPPSADVPRTLMVDGILDPQSLKGLENMLHYFRPYSKKIEQVDEGDVSRKSFKRLHRFRYSPTAAYGNNEVHLHPYYPRRLSVRESMRIQSVPDGYALPSDMSLTNMFKMVSNGVPVRLAEVIAQSIKEALLY